MACIPYNPFREQKKEKQSAVEAEFYNNRLVDVLIERGDLVAAWVAADCLSDFQSQKEETKSVIFAATERGDIEAIEKIFQMTSIFCKDEKEEIVERAIVSILRHKSDLSQIDKALNILKTISPEKAFTYEKILKYLKPEKFF